MVRGSGANKSSSPGSSESTSESSNFALVKWLSGKEKGKFTHNVQVSWILHFVPEEDFRNESYLVEWRVPPKPKNGWPVWDAQVLELSGDLDFLLQRMEEEMDSALHDGNRSPPKNGSGSKPVTTSTPKTNSSGPALSDLQKLCNVILSNASVSGTNNSTLEVPPGENLVRVGEVLTLTRSQHMDAKLARTPSAMTMELIRVTFSDKRLKRSSYAGQKRTRNGVVEQKPSLKKYRSTKDIQNFVNQRFPHFTQSQFSHAVNACTGNNVGQTPKPKLVDLSDSEGED